MNWTARIALGARITLGALACVALAAPVAHAQEMQIAWHKDLPTALAKAKETDRVLMVCINAKHVDGREDEEPAAKGLREIVYHNRQVVEQSRRFVCALLTAKGSSTEYDALRELGIDGDIISPQHIFVAPAGDRIVLRKEYWSHGSGDRAVDALLTMMAQAEVAAGKQAAMDAAGDGGPPAEDEARAAWIAERVAAIAGGVTERDVAIQQLLDADNDGDCTDALIAALPDYKKNVSTLRALIRALGRDGLESAALPIVEQLGHKEDSIRANAAVSLEYIGSSDKKVISALTKMTGKEKDEGIANHAYRALGRCGAGDAKVRGLLLKEAASAKSEFASYGACIGITYFEDDEKAMRGVEKVLKTIGVPGSRRGGGQNAVKRGLVSWSLASIGDEKSAEFVREDLIGGLENVKAFWVEGLRNFWESTAKACDGDEAALGEVEAGVRVFVQFAQRGGLERFGAESRNLMDEARRERKQPGAAEDAFEPNGDGILGDGE